MKRTTVSASWRHLMRYFPCLLDHHHKILTWGEVIDQQHQCCQCYYLSIDNFGVYAHDSETDKELLAVSGDVEKAIDTIKNQLCEARLVGARFLV